MIPELGQFSLILALAVALIQGTIPIIGAATGNTSWIAVARPAASAQALLLFFSFGCLTYAFVTSDFSVLYVASNSNTLMPLIYKVSAVWGAHEGSLLLWVSILAGWSLAVAAFSSSLPDDFVARVLGVMGLISIGFLLFVLLTSNPFERLYPVPLEGRTLNPLLQDPGLAIHPPMLYFGYVGFAVAFAFAIAALLGKTMDNTWARWARPWTNIAWAFLTVGIVLGSWWAYYELGWGGWWFWDPVENASFMPWLVGTALIHSMAATEKRDTLKAWTVLLAVFAFSLSLLGTFLVRSGVLTSVHAFATDPARGVFILIFLLVVIGGSLTLYAVRASEIKSTVRFSLVSREVALLINNLLLVATAAMVLLGTLFPLITDALGVGKYSVGPPYFNFMFLLLTIPLAMVVGIGAMARWKSDSLSRLLKPLAIPLALSVLGGLAFPTLVMGKFYASGVLGMTLAFWVTFSSLFALWERIANRTNKLGALAQTSRSFYGMIIAHVGIAVFIVGVTLTSLYSQEKDVAIQPGETYELGNYAFTFQGVNDIQGPNYLAQRGTVEVYKGDKLVTTLHPEKRNYGRDTMPMTEAAIKGSPIRDIYVALGEPVGNGSWALRIYNKAFVQWIWYGGILMAFGGVLAATDRRYRVRQRRESTVTAETSVQNV
ncbi:MAG: heme lyase CcmF/NrfE family subunit [Thiotrichales bacterium]